MSPTACVQVDQRSEPVRATAAGGLDPEAIGLWAGPSSAAEREVPAAAVVREMVPGTARDEAGPLRGVPGRRGPGGGGDQRTPRIQRVTGRASSSRTAPIAMVTAPSTPK